jgi:hypothetical protein
LCRIDDAELRQDLRVEQRALGDEADGDEGEQRARLKVPSGLRISR